MPGQVATAKVIGHEYITVPALMQPLMGKVTPDYWGTTAKEFNRIARELKIFLGDVRGGTADLDVGSVRFVDPGHRVLAAPVVIVVAVIVVVAVAHPLLVLTVSHVLPLIPALKVARMTDC